MDVGLAGKVALVTGGSKGIGQATALALAREGVQVAICARGVEALQQTANDIQAKTGHKVLAVRADMTSLEDIKRLVATTVQELGGLDILVNNALNSIPGHHPHATPGGDSGAAGAGHEGQSRRGRASSGTGYPHRPDGGARRPRGPDPVLGLGTGERDHRASDRR